MLNVSLLSDQISTSHRLQTRLKPKNSEPAASTPIIARFLSRDLRNQLIVSWHALQTYRNFCFKVLKTFISMKT